MPCVLPYFHAACIVMINSHKHISKLTSSYQYHASCPYMPRSNNSSHFPIIDQLSPPHFAATQTRLESLGCQTTLDPRRVTAIATFDNNADSSCVSVRYPTQRQESQITTAMPMNSHPVSLPG